MKTDLNFIELRELSDEELIEKYDYAFKKYAGKDVKYEISNLSFEIAKRFRAIAVNRIPIKERTRGFFERG